MTPDIVTDLRRFSATFTNGHHLTRDAADYIMRLRNAGDRLADALELGEWVAPAEWADALDAWREARR